MNGYFDEEKLVERSDTGLIGLILPFLRPYVKLIILSVITITLITALNLTIPYVTMYAIDNYIVPKDKSIKGSENKVRYLYFSSSDEKALEISERYPKLFTNEGSSIKILYKDLENVRFKDRLILRKGDITGVKTASIFLFGIIIISFILEFTQMMIIQFIGQSIMHDLRMKIFTHIQSRELSYFTRNSVGRLVTRVTNDVSNMQEMFTSVLTFVFKDFLMLTGIIVFLVSINKELSFVTFSVIPIIFITAFIFAKHSRESFRTLRLKVAEINSRFSETIGGMNILQLFIQEKGNFKTLQKLNNENYDAGLKQIHIFALFMPVIELLGTLTLALIIWYGGNLVLGNTITIGILVAFTSYLRMFFRPIRDIAEKYNILQNALSSAERIFLIFEDNKNNSSDNGTDTIDSIESLTFKNVDFSYKENEPVLKNISFKIKKGETLAVVGPTGSGKTTLINLLEKFYDADKGSVLINGKDIKRISTELLRDKTAVVMQNPFLFSGTIKENITGIKEISDEKFNRIVEDANCSSIIDKFENGAETVLAGDGDLLSSGERQLISIARAFAFDPDLIILDEATSYVDSDSEWKIKEALNRLMKERTTIIVAHRLLSAATADKIIVLKNGSITETGKHKELMDKKGFYYNLKNLE